MSKCPKCSAESGDDWTQCHGSCPIECSPHFNATLKKVLSPDYDPLFKKAVVLIADTDRYRLHYDCDRAQFTFYDKLKAETDVTVWSMYKGDFAKIRLRKVDDSYSLHVGRKTVWNYAKW